MKFCDKLLNLRKQNNMSQEQLADKLGVSRQAVSKWESAASVPDMEKMMQLCKILNCSLDELVDDGAGGNHQKHTDAKLTWHDYYKEVLEFITKTLNMFWSMRLTEKIKCFLEMLFLALILFFIWSIIGDIIHSSLYYILSLLPDTAVRLIYSISSFVYQIFGIVFGFVLLVHIFKIRYLDYFITIEDQDQLEKTIEIPIEEQEQKKVSEPRRFIEHKKNKIIIRDPKHSTYRFFDILAKIVIWFIKIMLIIFAIPCIICFIGLTFLAFCSIFYIKDGLIFTGLLIALLGFLVANYLVLKIIYYFIVNLKYQFQRIFYIFIISLILIGIGGSLTFCTYLTFSKLPKEEYFEKVTTHELNYHDALVLPLIYYENVEIIEDNTLSNIIINIKHYDKITPNLVSDNHSITNYQNNQYLTTTYETYHLNFNYNENLFDEMNNLLNNIKNKQRIDYYYQDSYQITITTSKDLLTKLENNYQNYYN